MIRVEKAQRKALEKAGALQYKRTVKGGYTEDGNFIIMNRSHSGKARHCYVIETPEILAFLNKWDMLNLQLIRPEQLDKLKTAGLVNDSQIQKSGEYKEGATVFVDSKNQIRMKKITSYMKTAGIWD